MILNEKLKRRITLEDILFNEPYEVEIPGYGTVLVRDPTEMDKIEARKAAMKHPLWEQMTEAERDAEFQKQLARVRLVEPKVSLEDYYNANPKLLAILDVLAMQYFKRMKELTSKYQNAIKDFLEVMKEERQESSMSS